MKQVYSALYLYLQVLGVKVPHYVVRHLLDTPVGMTLRGISDALDSLNIDYCTYQLKKDYQKKLSYPYLIEFPNSQVGFTIITNDNDKEKGCYKTLLFQNRLCRYLIQMLLSTISFVYGTAFDRTQQNTRRTNRGIITAACIVFTICGYSQNKPVSMLNTYKIYGKTINEKGKPISDLNIIISHCTNKKKIYAYTFSDNNGDFSLDISTRDDSVAVTVSGFNILPRTMFVSCKIDNPLKLTVIEQSQEIPEIVVKSTKIRSEGDTLNYLVSSFLHNSDQNIGDVLKRMPGITVSELGQISYKGMPIKKFYIEGLDLMKGRYGIATNNIDPNNIATVQVLENHQDVKALRGLRPEEKASINLRLKSGVRGVFNLVGTTCEGFEDNVLWNNTLVATYFKRNSQFFATYKGNNTGEDLSKELHSFSDGDNSHTSELATITLSVPPGLNKNRYYFNRSHSTTYNNVYRIGERGELGINAAYWNDSEARNCITSVTHLLPDASTVNINETQNGTLLQQMAYGDLAYLINKDHYYLKDQLKMEYINHQGHVDMKTEQHVSQYSRMEEYRLKNHLHLTQRTAREHGYEIVSTLHAEKRPHSLTANPNLFFDMLPLHELHQRATTESYGIRNSVSLLSTIVAGCFHFHPNAILNLQRDKLVSDLADFHNDLQLDHAETGIGIECMAKLSHLAINLYIPFIYRYMNLRHTDIRNDYVFEPSLKLDYRFDSSNEIRLSIGLASGSPNIEQLYSNYVLTSYRQMSAYASPSLYNSRMNFYRLSYDNKNIISMRFVGFDITYNHHSPKVLYGFIYDGDHEKLISSHSRETGEVLSVKIRGSKGFNYKKMKIGIESSYTYSNQPLFVQNKVMRYSSNSVQVYSDLSFSPFSWLNISYEGKFFQNKTNSMSVCRSLTNMGVIDVCFPFGLNFQGSVSHYYNNMNADDSSFILTDFLVRYSFKRIMLSLQINNILNRKQYHYSNVNELSSNRNVYDIRGRNLLLSMRIRII